MASWSGRLGSPVGPVLSGSTARVASVGVLMAADCMAGSATVRSASSGRLRK